MSQFDDDGVEEGLRKAATVTVGAAVVVARRLADRLRQQAEERRQAEALEAARLQARRDSERAGAMAQLQATDGAWLAGASTEDAAQAWSTARAWSEVDESFAPHEKRLRAGIEQRWGVDVDAAGAAAGLRAEADRERNRARGEDAERNVDTAMAGGILAGTSEEVAALEDAQQHRSNAEEHSASAASPDAAAYDTSHRRELLVERATAAGVDQETAEGRGRAANANAKPVKNATTKRGGTKTARRGARAGVDRTRTDQLSR